MVKKVWLDSEILDWNASVEVSHVHSDHAWKRPYEIWSHVEKKLDKIGTELDRVDSIINLRRCIDRRIRGINDIYNLKKIPISEKPKGTLELLQYLGIARAIMVQKLIDIRDSVEHEGAIPPSHNDCLSFLEFVWYFLRSTDRLVRQSVDSFVLNPTLSFRGPYYVHIEVNPYNDWIPKIESWTSPLLISDQLNESWVTVIVKETETREDVLKKFTALVNKESSFDEFMGKEPEDIHLIGEIRGPSNHLHNLFKIYFNLL